MRWRRQPLVASAAPPEGYIVVLKDDTPDVPAVAAAHARNFGVGVRYVYTKPSRATLR